MNALDFVTTILPRILGYKLQRHGVPVPVRLLTLTHSVTFACQSRCKTCNIGHRYLQNPELAKDDLSLEEIEKIYKSIGPVYFYNISGGEPFLRKDLPEVVELAMRHLKPGVVHIPTNALQPAKIEQTALRILEVMRRYNPRVPLTIKPSVDGVGDKHDEVRGVKGNFVKLEETIARLKGVERQYPNFHLELGTVVSNFNINSMDEIEDWVHRQGVQSYRNEIAEQREEFFNIGEAITPSDEVYARLMTGFKEKIKKNVGHKRSLAQMTESLRLVYYDLVVEILKHKTQVIPCYGGISNVHLNYNGEIWPCCVLGYAHAFGNLREYEYDFARLYRSTRARDVRAYIKAKKCYCPLANQSYSNMIVNFRYLLRVLASVIRSRM